jgi:brefeldin A-resistance guanine nucleotide exchange factor 1
VQNEAGESLKNLILVMHSSGLLVPPAPNDSRTEEQKKLWAESEVKIERVLPGFLAENLAPPPAAARASADQAAVPSPAS